MAVFDQAERFGNEAYRQAFIGAAIRQGFSQGSQFGAGDLVRDFLVDFGNHDKVAVFDFFSRYGHDSTVTNHFHRRSIFQHDAGGFGFVGDQGQVDADTVNDGVFGTVNGVSAFDSSHLGGQLLSDLGAVGTGSHGVSDVVHATSSNAERCHQLREGFQNAFLLVVFSYRLPLTASVGSAFQLLFNGHGTVFVHDGTQCARDVAFQHGQLRSALVGLCRFVGDGVGSRSQHAVGDRLNHDRVGEQRLDLSSDGVDGGLLQLGQSIFQRNDALGQCFDLGLRHV